MQHDPQDRKPDIEIDAHRQHAADRQAFGQVAEGEPAGPVDHDRDARLPVVAGNFSYGHPVVAAKLVSQDDQLDGFIRSVCDLFKPGDALHREPRKLRLDGTGEST